MVHTRVQIAAVIFLTIQAAHSFVHRVEEWIRAFRFHVDRSGRLWRRLGATQVTPIVFLLMYPLLEVDLKVYLIRRTHSETTAH